MKTCAYCGEEYRNQRRKYCSIACMEKADDERTVQKYPYVPVVRTEKSCKQCSKKFLSIKSEFCSALCRALYAYQKKKVDRFCACGRKLEHGSQKRCLSCQKEYKRQSDNLRIQKPQKNRKKYPHNPELHKKNSQVRRAKKNGLASNFTPEQWDQVVSDFAGKCAYCGETAVLHQDHFIPVTKGGSYTKSNIIPACQSCNSSKNNKHPLDWLITKENGLAIFSRIKQYLGL